MNIHRKYIIDEHGNPNEVIISFKDFQKIEEMLGMDLDDKTIKELVKARKDREAGKKDAYIDLDSI
ncbi:MAG: hypothetical protein SVR08_16805 [Spirochaetota bacterium]|nr:hypothetical protein [Spirochaetota bacterium]